MVELRKWQAEALEVLRREWRPGQAVVVRAVMGAGKSILMATLCEKLTGTILVTAPTIKLVEQLASTIASVTGEEVGRYYTHDKSVQRITVACYDSMLSLVQAGFRADAWIADECHRTEVEDVIEAAKLLAAKWRLGFTATPYLSDSSKRLTLWDRQVVDYGVQEAIRDGVVVRPDVRHYTGTGDTIDQACLEMIEKAEGPGIVSAISIADANAFVWLAREHGLTSAAIHSRQPKDEQAALIEALRVGKLHHLVHINLLTEGVDLPWLRWLCARRPVSSRVRFAQEVGRVLRAHPGKTSGVVYDPNDLFGVLSLSYEACLGDIDEKATAEEVAAFAIDFAIAEIKAMPNPPMLEGVPVALLDPIASYLRRLRIAFQAAGAVEMTVPSGRWRKDEVSALQLSLLQRMDLSIPKWGPATHTKALRSSISAAHVLAKGDVSDLISVMKAVRKLNAWPVEVADA
jgi:hypothetical protein